jgi:hypothetical protein
MPRVTALFFLAALFASLFIALASPIPVPDDTAIVDLKTPASHAGRVRAFRCCSMALYVHVTPFTHRVHGSTQVSAYFHHLSGFVMLTIVIL